jgi:hypothetical protein
VIDQPGRTPPSDPWRITLSYRHDHRWWNDANQAPEGWHVSADVLDDSGTDVESHVGDMHVVAVDLDETTDPFGLLDAEDGDLGLVAETVFDPATGGLHPDLDEQLEPFGNRILILDTVQLTAPWRGFGLGALLTGTAIKKLSGGARAAVCYPAPLAEPDDPTDDPDAQQRAVAALGRVWARLGFAPFRAGVHTLDLNLVTLDEHLAKLRVTAEQHRHLD